MYKQTEQYRLIAVLLLFYCGGSTTPQNGEVKALSVTVP